VGGIFPENHQSIVEVTLGRLRILLVMYFRFVYAVHKLWDLEIEIIPSSFCPYTNVESFERHPRKTVILLIVFLIGNGDY
jgi:hypothetical protein